MTVGERIRAARVKHQMTQRELGERCGIAEPTIRRYELGKLNPKLGTVQRIAAAMGIPTSSLLDISSQVQPENDDGMAEQTPFEMDIYQKRVKRLLAHFSKLNDKGQVEAIKRLTEMARLPEYQKVESNFLLSETLLQYSACETGMVYQIQVDQTEEDCVPNQTPFGGQDISLEVQHIVMESADSAKGRRWHYWCYLSPVPEEALEGILSRHDSYDCSDQLTLVFADRANFEAADRIWDRRHFDDNRLPPHPLLLITKTEPGEWVIQNET